MAPITNLFCQFAYPDVGSSFPICVLMHGFGDSATAFTAPVMKRIAQYGLFVAAVGMRGRNGASGSQDASGREIYDIYDVLATIRSVYASKVSADRAGIVGYSGGGGNALAAACKFPDAWSMVVSFFGPSDYGRDAIDGWYANGGNQATLSSWIGGTPGAVPDAYFSRDATYAMANYSGGALHLYHDDQDTSVPIVHSERVDAVATTHYTTTTDSPRWIHGYPIIGDTGEPTIQAEPVWAAAMASASAWTVPVAGSIKVIGYIKTKRFSIFLSTGTAEVADVTYDTTIDQYTVTPQTGSMDVVIVQGAKSASQTINSPTVITVT